MKKKKKKTTDSSEEEYTAAEIEQIDQSLFNRLETEKKARYNWRKILTMI